MIQDDRKQDIDVHNIKKSDLVHICTLCESVSQSVSVSDRRGKMIVCRSMLSY